MMRLADEPKELQTTDTVTCKTIVTTLYDVIAALNAHLPPEADEVVIAAVQRLCENGRLRRLPHPEIHDILCA